MAALFVVALAAGCGEEKGEPRGSGTPTTTSGPAEAPASLSCTGPRTIVNIHYLANTGGTQDLLLAARSALGKGLRKDDRLERLQSADAPLVLVVRDGDTVAVVRFMSADVGWLANEVEMCADFDE